MDGQRVAGLQPHEIAERARRFGEDRAQRNADVEQRGREPMAPVRAAVDPLGVHLRAQRGQQRFEHLDGVEHVDRALLLVQFDREGAEQHGVVGLEEHRELRVRFRADMGETQGGDILPRAREPGAHAFDEALDDALLGGRELGLLAPGRTGLAAEEAVDER